MTLRQEMGIGRNGVYTSKLLYLAQPYSTDPIEAYVYALKCMTKALQKRLLLFSPIVNSHLFGANFPAQVFYDYDLEFIKHTKPTMLFALGWEASKGCLAEYTLAQDLGLKCYAADPLLNWGDFHEVRRTI